MTKKKITSKRQLYYIQILKTIQNNSTLTKISQTLKKPKSNIYRTLRVLEGKNYIFQKDKHWHITDTGKKVITSAPPCPKKITFSDKKPVFFRSHHVTVYVVHREARENWENNFRGQLVEVFVPCLSIKVSVQFGVKGIVFTLQTPQSKNRDMAGRVLHERVQAVVDYVSNRFKCRFVRPGDIGKCVRYQELAILGTRLAEDHIQSGKRLLVYDWEHEGKPRWLADMSKSPEWEHVGVNVWDDELESRWFIEELADGRLRDRVQSVDKLIQAQANTQRQLDVYGRNIVAHVDLVRGINKGIMELTASVKELRRTVKDRKPVRSKRAKKPLYRPLTDFFK